MKNLENYSFDISLWKYGPCDTDSPIEIRNLGWKRQLNEAFTSKQWLNQITVEVQLLSTSPELSKNISKISTLVKEVFLELSSAGAVELLKQVETEMGFLEVEEKNQNSTQEKTRKTFFF